MIAFAHPPVPPVWIQRPCLRLDLSAANPRIAGVAIDDPAAFGGFITAERQRAGADWAAGGWGEVRTVYALSELFDGEAGEPRRLHLGLDLWLAAGTPVYAVADGRIHSLADNARYGDYGPTLIIEHGPPIGWALYGHLSRDSLRSRRPGQPVRAGEHIAALGTPAENLGWPPHLHLQLIREIGDYRGDFPGVCRVSERDQWLARCPDPTPALGVQHWRTRRERG